MGIDAIRKIKLTSLVDNLAPFAGVGDTKILTETALGSFVFKSNDDDKLILWHNVGDDYKWVVEIEGTSFNILIGRRQDYSGQYPEGTYLGVAGENDVLTAEYYTEEKKKRFLFFGTSGRRAK